MATGSDLVTGAEALEIKSPVLAPKALDDALGVTQAVNRQVAAQMAADPLNAALQAEMAKTAAAKDALATTVQANMAKRQEVMDAPLPELPPVPTAPTLTPPPTKLPDNPLRTLGQYLPVLGALSSSNVRNNTVSALNAASAAMNAVQADDARALEQAHKSWMASMEAAKRQHDMEMQSYEAALTNRKMTMDERLARINALAAQNQDALVLAQTRSGDIAGINAAINMRKAAGEQAFSVLRMAQEADLKRQDMANEMSIAQMREAGENTRAAMARDAATARAGMVTSTDELAASLLQKRIEAGEITPEQAMAELAKLKQSGATQNVFPFGGPGPGFTGVPRGSGLTGATDAAPDAGATDKGGQPAPKAKEPGLASRVVSAVKGELKGSGGWVGAAPKGMPPIETAAADAKARIAAGADPYAVRSSWIKKGYNAVDFDRGVLGR